MSTKIDPHQARQGMVALYQRAVLDPATQRALTGVERAGLVVLNAARSLTPIDTQALYNSARMEAQSTSKGAEGYVSYGGNFPVAPTRNAPSGIVTYAIKIHEDVTALHRTGKAKFLEDAGNDTQTEQKAAFVAVFKEDAL